MPNTNRSRQSRSAFTLIELLAVIAVIAILAAITFGLGQGVRERANVSRAQSELSALAQYLEQYRSYYGDFPRVDRADSESSATATKLEGEDGIVELYNALNGMRGVEAGSDFNPGERQRSIIDRSRFYYQYSPSGNPPEPTTEEQVETWPVALIDPWDNAYRYYYDPGGDWENPSYVLFSTGPDGEYEPPANDGFLDRDHEDNLENVYPE